MLKTHFDSLSFQVPQLIIKVQAGFLQVPITTVPSPNLTTLSTTIDHSKKLLASFPTTSGHNSRPHLVIVGNSSSITRQKGMGQVRSPCANLLQQVHHLSRTTIIIHCPSTATSRCYSVSSLHTNPSFCTLLSTSPFMSSCLIVPPF